jgi:hypothetical protein
MRKNPIIYRLAQALTRWLIGENKRRIYCKDTFESFDRYSDYLKSRHWRAVKKRYRSRHRYKCTRCRCAEALHLHHLRYSNIGNEPDEDLIYLCAKCHTKEHKGRKKRR